MPEAAGGLYRKPKRKLKKGGKTKPSYDTKRKFGEVFKPKRSK